MTRSLFRKLLITWWILLVASLIVMWTTEQNLPPELIAYLARSDAESTQVESAGLVLAGFLSVVLVIATVGLFFLKAWARQTFVLANIGVVFLTPFFEPAAVSVWTESVGFVHTVLTGGLLFSLYLPPLKQMIDKDSTASG